MPPECPVCNRWDCNNSDHAYLVRMQEKLAMATKDALTRDELAVVLGTLDGAEDNAIEDQPGRRIRSALTSAIEKLTRQDSRLRAIAAQPPKGSEP